MFDRVYMVDHSKPALLLTGETEWGQVECQREYISCREQFISFSGVQTHTTSDGVHEEFVVYHIPIESLEPSIKEDMLSVWENNPLITIVWAMGKNSSHLVPCDNPQQWREIGQALYSEHHVWSKDGARERVKQAQTDLQLDA